MPGFSPTRGAALAAITAVALLAPAIGPARAQNAAAVARDSAGVLIYPNEPNSSL